MKIPGLSNDIQMTVSSCSTCAKFGHQQQKEPLVPPLVSELPWSKVAMDILDFRTKTYLVVVDCYSHFPELRQLSHKAGSDVILALKSIFSVHGIPRSIMTDNMPFNSLAMREFADEWGFSIMTFSPPYPRSNGIVERYVETIKQCMRKSEDTGEDIYPSLLAYRQTPVTGCVYSPAEMLFNRCLRSSLPATSKTLAPSTIQPFELLRQHQRLTKEH